MVFEQVLDPVFSPLMGFGPFWIVLITSLIVSVLITLIYKWMTDQELMKTLKEDMKTIQKDIKKLKDNPAKMMEMQKKAMEKNMKYMMHSMRPTLITFIPLIVIFGWLNANMAYEPINPLEEFTTTLIFKDNVGGDVELVGAEGIEILSQNPQQINDNEAKWTLKGEEGDYFLEFSFNERTYDTEFIITEGNKYTQPIKKVKDDYLKQIVIGNKKVIVMNLFGWKVGWLGTYIIFSLVFSMSLRKVLKVH